MRLLGLLLLLGCNGEALPAAEDGGARPQSGVYFLTTTVEQNDCRPLPTHVADFDVLVWVGSQGMSLTFPGLGLGFEQHDIVGDETALSDTVCGATEGTLIEVLTADAHSLGVRRTTTWTGTAHADRSCNRADELPAADCAFIEELRYRLKQPCPCSNLRVDTGGQLSCVCS